MMVNVTGSLLASVAVSVTVVAVSSAVVIDWGSAVGAMFGLVIVSADWVTGLQLPAVSITRVDTTCAPGAGVAGIVPVSDAPAGVSAEPLPTPGSVPIHHSPPATPDSASVEVAVIVEV